MPIECVEILNDGEGEPGPPIGGAYHRSACPEAADYAEQAAALLDEREMRETGVDASEFDGSSRVIEVRGLAGFAGPRRFRVRCRVERRYTAEPDGA